QGLQGPGQQGGAGRDQEQRPHPHHGVRGRRQAPGVRLHHGLHPGQWREVTLQRRKVEVIPNMRRLIAFALVLLAARSAHAAAGPLPAYREVLNLRYAPGAGNRHTLDVFTPAEYGGKKASRPVVLFVHGGTWMAGDKNFFGMYRGVGRALASGGSGAVLATYRLSPRVP